MLKISFTTVKAEKIVVFVSVQAGHEVLLRWFSNYFHPGTLTISRYVRIHRIHLVSQNLRIRVCFALGQDA